MLLYDRESGGDLVDVKLPESAVSKTLLASILPWTDGWVDAHIGVQNGEEQL